MKEETYCYLLINYYLSIKDKKIMKKRKCYVVPSLEVAQVTCTHAFLNGSLGAGDSLNSTYGTTDPTTGVDAGSSNNKSWGSIW